ncbi:sodium:solute symporter family protein [Streptomyces odontomachi]|uniref:sodium:solute symporter family protein n=1 Tax=Streptomyces odontomachi TaxID=2944940 RepID=UPI00210DC173|nr:sodium:solute symporter family protein [Streptomyces sp. ODS25]
MNAGLVCMAAVCLVALVIALLSRSRNVDLEQWSIGGRRFGAPLIFLLLAGEIYTTFAFLGGSGWAYGQGGAALYVVAYSPLAYVVSYWLLPVVWRYAKATGAISQSDFFTSKYDSPVLGVLVTVIGVGAMIPYMTLQLQGISIIASEASYGRLGRTPAVLIACALLVAYAVAGGMRGAALNAAIKDILILATVIALVVYLPHHYFGSWEGMFRAVQLKDPGHATLRVATGHGVTWFISTVTISAIGFFMWPHLFTASFAARNEQTFRRNAVLLPLYNLMLLFALLVGFTAFARIPGLSGTDQDLALLRLVKDALPPWLVGLVGAAGLLTALVPGAVLATTTGTLLANNVYRPLRPGTGDRQLAGVARGAVVLVVAAAALLVFYGGSTLVSLLIVGYSYIVQLLPALLTSLLPRNPLERWGAGVGAVVGVVVASLFAFNAVTVADLQKVLPTELAQLNSGVFALVANVLVAFTVSGAMLRSRRSRPSPRPQPAPEQQVPGSAAP